MYVKMSVFSDCRVPCSFIWLHGMGPCIAHGKTSNAIRTSYTCNVRNVSLHFQGMKNTDQYFIPKIILIIIPSNHTIRNLSLNYICMCTHTRLHNLYSAGHLQSPPRKTEANTWLRWERRHKQENCPSLGTRQSPQWPMWVALSSEASLNC